MAPRTSTDRAHGAPGWLLASCIAALTVTAHGSAGGTLSDSSLTALLATLLAWGGTSLARRGGLLMLVGVLAVTQAAQHVLLTEIAHVHHGPPVNGWLMLTTHAVATVLSAVLLLRAGGAIAGIAAAARWLAGRLQTLCAAPPSGPARPGSARVAARPGVLLEVLLRRVSPRRGPPLHS